MSWSDNKECNHQNWTSYVETLYIHKHVSLYKQKCLFPQIFSRLGIKQLIQEVVNCYIQNSKPQGVSCFKLKKKKKNHGIFVYFSTILNFS